MILYHCAAQLDPAVGFLHNASPGMRQCTSTSAHCKPMFETVY